MAKKEWFDWLKCNIVEIIILILVLVLVVKAFIPIAVTEVSAVPMAEAPVVVEAAPVVEVPLETPAVEAPVVAEVVPSSNETAALVPAK